MFNIIILDCHGLNDERINRHISSLLPENQVIRINYSGDTDFSKWTNIKTLIPCYTYSSKKPLNTGCSSNNIYYIKAGVDRLKKIMSIVFSQKSIHYVQSKVTNESSNIIIHVHDPLLLLLSLRLKHKFPSAKIVYDRHEHFDLYKNTSLPYRISDSMNRICERMAKNTIGGVVFVVPGFEQHLQSLFPKSKITVVPNYIDFKLVDDAKTEDKIHNLNEASHLKCIYFGTLSRTSREIELIIYLAKELLAKYEFIEFAVGGKTDDNYLLQEFSSLEKLYPGRFRYTGFIPYADLIKETQEAAIGFLFMKLTGSYNVVGSQNKIYEYLKCGVIPIVRRNGDSSFLQPEGLVCGPDESWQDILNKVETLIRMPRNQLQEKMRSLFVKSRNYSFESVAKNYITLYQELHEEK